MRRIAFVLAMLIPVLGDAQPRCKTGIPCGGSCISASKTCRIGSAPVRTDTQKTQPKTMAAPVVSGAATSAAMANGIVGNPLGAAEDFFGYLTGTLDRCNLLSGIANQFGAAVDKKKDAASITRFNLMFAECRDTSEARGAATYLAYSAQFADDRKRSAAHSVFAAWVAAFELIAPRPEDITSRDAATASDQRRTEALVSFQRRVDSVKAVLGGPPRH